MNRSLNNNFDIIIIGAGIIGASISDFLSKFAIRIALLERNSYPAIETSSHNSGVIHGGFDPRPGTMKAKFNVRGNALWRAQIFGDLNFPRRQLDSFVVAYTAEELVAVKELVNRGYENGLKAMEVFFLDGEQLRQREPALSSEIKGGLVCTTSWLIDVYEASRAMIARASGNGTEVFYQCPVTEITAVADRNFIVTTTKESFTAKIIINAAGHNADLIAALAGYGDFTQKRRRGQYCVIAPTDPSKTIRNSICFRVPTKISKGVLVEPTLSGTLLVGPTAEDDIARNDVQLIKEHLISTILKDGQKIVPELETDRLVTTYAGSRAIESESGDFFIRPAKANPAFIHVAGIQSPGISAAPAIAEYVATLIEAAGLILKPR